MTGFQEFAVTVTADADDKVWAKIIARKSNEADAPPVAMVKIDSNTADLAATTAKIMATLHVQHKSPESIWISDPCGGFGKSLPSWLKHVYCFTMDRSIAAPLGFDPTASSVSGVASLLKLPQAGSSVSRAVTTAAAASSSTGAATASRGGSGDRELDKVLHNYLTMLGQREPGGKRLLMPITDANKFDMRLEVFLAAKIVQKSPGWRNRYVKQNLSRRIGKRRSDINKALADGKDPGNKQRDAAEAWHASRLLPDNDIVIDDTITDVYDDLLEALTPLQVDWLKANYPLEDDDDTGRNAEVDSDHEALAPAGRAEDPPATAEGVRQLQAESDEDEDAVLRAQAALAARDAELADPQVASSGHGRQPTRQQAASTAPTAGNMQRPAQAAGGGRGRQATRQQAAAGAPLGSDDQPPAEQAAGGGRGRQATRRQAAAGAPPGSSNDQSPTGQGAGGGRRPQTARQQATALTPAGSQRPAQVAGNGRGRQATGGSAAAAATTPSSDDAPPPAQAAARTPGTAVRWSGGSSKSQKAKKGGASAAKGGGGRTNPPQRLAAGGRTRRAAAAEAASQGVEDAASAQPVRKRLRHCGDDDEQRGAGPAASSAEADSSLADFE